jgi:Homeodomain-like domain
VARKTVDVWLARYEAGGLEGLADGSHRPRSCPHQMPAAVEVALVELRLAHSSWEPRRLSFELGRRGMVVAESAAYRALARLSLVDPAARLMLREQTRAVCDGLTAALAAYGAPEQILTDNGKV